MAEMATNMAESMAIRLLNRVASRISVRSMDASFLFSVFYRRKIRLIELLLNALDLLALSKVRCNELLGAAL